MSFAFLPVLQTSILFLLKLYDSFHSFGHYFLRNFTLPHFVILPLIPARPDPLLSITLLVTSFLSEELLLLSCLSSDISLLVSSTEVNLSVDAD